MRNASRRESQARRTAPPGREECVTLRVRPRRTEFACARCQRTVTTAIEGLFYNPRVGSPQCFCSPSCRQAAWRCRRAAAPKATALRWRGERSRRLSQDGSAPQGEGAGPEPKDQACPISLSERDGRRPRATSQLGQPGSSPPLSRTTRQHHTEGGELLGTAP